MLDSVASEWIAAATIFVIGFLSRLVIQAILRRNRDAFSMLTGLGPAKSEFHLVFGLVDSTVKPGNRYAEEGDVSALTAATLLLASSTAEKNLRVINARSALPVFRGFERLLSISGPVWNPVTKALMASAGFEAGFSTRPVPPGEDNDTLVYPTDDGTAEVFTTRQNGIPRECYCLVICSEYDVPNSRRTQRTAVVAGISTLGTYGGLYWLRGLSHKNWSDVFDTKFEDDMARCIVLRVQDRSPDGFFAYASMSSTPGFITVDMIALFERPRHAPKGQSRRVDVARWMARIGPGR